MASEQDRLSGGETQQAWPQRMAQYLQARRRPVFILAMAIGLALVWAWLPSATRSILIGSLLTHRLIAGLLLFLGLLSLSLLWSAGQRLDAWIFLRLNLRSHRRPWADRLMFAATQIGNGVLAFILAGIFWGLGYRMLAIELALGTLALSLIVEIMKTITGRRRPFHALEGARLVGYRERGRSFPSGHTAQTFFLATILHQYFQTNPLWSTFFYAVAVLVGFTRIYVGVHYPRDVIGGAVLGFVWGSLATLANPYLAARFFG